MLLDLCDADVLEGHPTAARSRGGAPTCEDVRRPLAHPSFPQQRRKLALAWLGVRERGETGKGGRPNSTNVVEPLL